MIVLLVMAPLLATAADRVVYLAGSGNAALDDQVVRMLGQTMGERTEIRRIASDQAAMINRSPIIAVGPTAFSNVRQSNRDAYVLALLVRQELMQPYVTGYPGQLSAIYYDVPLLRQALIGKAILPHANHIAILASAASASDYEPLLDQLPAYDLKARVFVVDSLDELIPTVIRALNYGDFLLASNDETIYNPRTIKHILLTAYRRDRIVIGPNQAYVKAGSIASGYAPFGEMIQGAAEAVDQFYTTGRLPPAGYPPRFSVTINRQVARSLNIPIPEPEDINQWVNDTLKADAEAGHD
ncbi:ABC transporter substrate-binding protein [Marinobacter sp. C2H3]|uniref:ABC transporter substrate-binding protein n=1 Tax=Marinobacter sp. C2H3 TaxID=3119003 RepID=UPI00300EA2C0